MAFAGGVEVTDDDIVFDPDNIDDASKDVAELVRASSFHVTAVGCVGS